MAKYCYEESHTLDLQTIQIEKYETYLTAVDNATLWQQREIATVCSKFEYSGELFFEANR